MILLYRPSHPFVKRPTHGRARLDLHRRSHCSEDDLPILTRYMPDWMESADFGEPTTLIATLWRFRAWSDKNLNRLRQR